MTKPRISDLSDAECIQWAQRDNWTCTQAIFLLLGMRPPERDLPFDELYKKHKAARLLLAMLGEYGDAWSNHPFNWVRFAHESMKAELLNSWIAIFSNAVPPSIKYIFNEEPDYCRFVGAITHKHKLPLGELVKFALCIGEKSEYRREREYNDVIAAMVSRLQLQSTNVLDSRDMLVDVEAFLDKYPRNQFRLDSRCSHWHEWTKSNREISNWLAGNGAVAQKQVGKVTKSSAWIFRPVGGHWEVGSADKLKLFRSAKGFNDFAFAARYPGKDVLPVLVSHDPEQRIPTFGSDNTFDAKARTNVQQKIQEIEESLSIARSEQDADRIDEYEHEIQDLQKHLKSSTRPGYARKALDAGDTVKKITNTLRHRKKSVVRKLHHAGLADIANHIDSQFEIASRSAIYIPSDPKREWILDP